MSLLVRDRLTPTRVTGNPLRWAVDLGVGAALVPLSIAWFPLWFGVRELADLAVVGPAALLGAAVGALSPILLDWFRRGVPLWLLTILATVTSSATMVVAWWAGGAHDTLMLAVLVPVAGSVGAVLWLPYTIATVTGRRTWPVVLAAAVAAPVFAMVPIQIVTLLM